MWVVNTLTNIEDTVSCCVLPSQVPAQSGWILDDFPYNISQAQLLEEALGGSVEGNEVVPDRTNLAANPDPPEPSPFPAHVLDLAVLLDIPDEDVVRHAYSHIGMCTLYRCIQFLRMWIGWVHLFSV